MRKQLTISVIFLFSITSQTFSQKAPSSLPQNRNDSAGTGNLPLNKTYFKTRLDSSSQLLLKPLLGEGFNPVQSTNNFLKKSISSGLISTLVNPLKDINKELRQSAEQLYKQPFKLKDFKASSVGQYTNQMFDSMGYSNFRNINLLGNFVAGGIPVVLEYRYSYFPEVGANSYDNFSFEFDKNNYIQSLKAKIEGKFNPADYLGNLTNSIDSLKQVAGKSLQEELKSIGEKYKGTLDAELRNLGDTKKFIDQGIMSVQQLLNGAAIEAGSDRANIYQQLIDKRNMGQVVDMNLLQGLENEMYKQKGVQELAQKVKEHYMKWESSGLFQTIKKTELLKKEKLLQIAGNPEIIKKIAKSKLKLNGLQRFFLNVDKLNAGQNVVNQSPLSLSNFLSNGANVDFLKNNNFISGIIGSRKPMNNIFDQPFTDNIFNTGVKAVGFSFGKGVSTSSHSHFSVTHFQQKDISNGSEFMPYLMPRNSSVITFSKGLNLGANNHVTFDLSKSSSQYINEINPDSSSVSKSSFGNLFSGGSMMNNVAIAIDYSGEFREIDLQHKVSVKMAADRYFNPGIHFIPGGTKELMVDLKKNFLKKRLQVRMRTDVRQYDLSAGTGSRFNHFNSMADLRWRMKKGKYFSVRYMPTRGNRSFGGTKSMANSMDRISAELNLNYKIKNHYYRNYISLAHQSNKYQYLNGGKTQNISWLISSMQNITIGRQLVYWNVQYNYLKDASQFIFFNSSLNTDLGLTYTIIKNITASSSLNYNGIKGWYSQLGIRQNISGQIGKRLVLSMYLDAGKNLKVFQQLPYNNTIRADWSIQYLLN